MLARLLKPLQIICNLYILRKQNVRFGKNLRINGYIYIMGKIEIGENVSINSGYKYNPIGGQERTVLITHGTGTITIGNNVGMSNCALVARDSIIIEDNVKIGGSVKIYDNDFHSVQYEERLEKKDTHIEHKAVCVKKGAFIGAHSIILKGVTIGEKSVIGAGSVVTKNVPNGEIWAGNPAKFIKKVRE